MIIKASGRSALILAATGLWVCYAGPSQATADTDDAAATAKHATHHSKKYTHHKSSGFARHSATGSKTADTAADDSDKASPMPFSAIPPSVANANAQLASPDTPAGSAQAMSARANDILAAVPTTPVDAQPGADTPVVAADQLNDVDRALHASTPPATTVVMASAVAPATPVTAVGSNENSTWDQTSLIGKIFIGFGALLTMASAARMFIA
jgi:FtsZ-interacting cell division protein ZipA